MSKSKGRKQWPPIYKQRNRSGQYTWYVDLRKVDGGREGFSNAQEANTRAELARAQRTNEGVSAFALPPDVRVDACRANQLLAPHGVSIFEAAKYYDKHVLMFKTAPTVKEIVDQYLADSAARNLRPRTLLDLRHRLNTFAEGFGGSKLSDLTLNELKEWITDDQWKPRTRVNFLTKISQLYSYAIRHKWADTNLAANIDRPTVDETTPEIFTVEQAENLLTNASKFGLLPFIAIGLFAGVRTAEQIRLTGKNINFQNKTILVGPDAAKKRSQRIIEMSEALLSWLELCKEELKNGPIYSESLVFREKKAQLVEAAAIADWPPNGLRHSFGSYHLAMFESVEKTAHKMGNSADIVHKHYKALVTKSEAEKFWALRPKNGDQAPTNKD